MTSEVELQVKVKIDDAGRVTQADTLTATGPATRRLMDVTEKVARLWKFAPAMRGSEPVPSEAVVVFRFRPSPE
jgi:outer membrane biosynthesis protein TonB